VRVVIAARESLNNRDSAGRHTAATASLVPECRLWKYVGTADIRSCLEFEVALLFGGQSRSVGRPAIVNSFRPRAQRNAHPHALEPLPILTRKRRPDKMIALFADWNRFRDHTEGETTDSQ
jgi:hypothetical protein